MADPPRNKQSRTAWRLSRSSSTVGRLATGGSSAADDEKRRGRTRLPSVRGPDFRHLNSVAILCAGRPSGPLTGRLKGLEASCLWLFPPQPYLPSHVNQCTRGPAWCNTWIAPSTTTGLISSTSVLARAHDPFWHLGLALPVCAGLGGTFENAVLDRREPAQATTAVQTACSPRGPTLGAPPRARESS